jgi:hypothetical protein
MYVSHCIYCLTWYPLEMCSFYFCCRSSAHYGMCWRAGSLTVTVRTGIRPPWAVLIVVAVITHKMAALSLGVTLHVIQSQEVLLTLVWMRSKRKIFLQTLGLAWCRHSWTQRVIDCSCWVAACRLAFKDPWPSLLVGFTIWILNSTLLLLPGWAV